jgi:hypothetical protein
MVGDSCLETDMPVIRIARIEVDAIAAADGGLAVRACSGEPAASPTASRLLRA